MNHQFDTAHAKQYGLIEAILINNFQHWIKLNRDNNRNLRDGKTWTYNSVKSFHKQYFYVSADKIRRALDNLEQKGVIVKGVYNERPGDRTTWYAFADEDFWIPEQDHLAPVPSGRVDSAKSPIGTRAKSTNKTDINTDVKTDGTRASRLPTDWTPSADDIAFCKQERQDLNPQDTASRFRDYWIAQPDSKAKKTDWPATWRNWVRNQRQQTVQQNRPTPQSSQLGPAGQATAAAAERLMARLQQGDSNANQ